MNPRTKKRPTRPQFPFPPETEDDGFQPVQIIGNPLLYMRGVKPVYRALTLDDITDDCEACRANRAAIEAGNPPMAWVFEDKPH